MIHKTILLVDDEETILESLGIYLKKNDYEVATATSGEEAVAKFRCSHFDLVVTDLVMGEMSGVAVLKEIKQIDPGVCIFILTGYGSVQTAVESLRSGAEDYIQKPCDAEELLAKIDHFFEGKELSQNKKNNENILPICMYCKNIRDDTGTVHGKGEWMLVEKYLSRMNGKSLSHGCCPQCYKKHIHS